MNDAKRLAQVRKELELIHKHLAELEEVITQLKDKLSSVLREEMQLKEESDKEEAAKLVPLA